jgi:hypothetical protein
LEKSLNRACSSYETLIQALLTQCLAMQESWVNTRITPARLGAAGLVHALRDQQPPTDCRPIAVAEEFASILHAIRKRKQSSTTVSAMATLDQWMS